MSVLRIADRRSSQVRPSSGASLPLSSSSRRSAVFLPMPGTLTRRLASCAATAWASSSVFRPESSASAMRGPTPLILISSRNDSRSVRVRKP
jgi:hypothetical protein